MDNFIKNAKNPTKTQNGFLKLLYFPLMLVSKP